jgi:phenylacetic acid degradation operon negative regulatory protein
LTTEESNIPHDELAEDFTNKAINDFISKRTNEIKLSGTSLIVTIFGDLVTQHGHWISLSSLIQALAPLGINDRLVRTSVYRLVQSDWLTREKVKKNTYYSFTEMAKRHYDKATKRIYTTKHPEWDGSWLIVLPVFVADDKKESLHKELAWLGFSTLSTGVWAHPSIEKESLDDTLKQLNLLDAVIVFNGNTYQEHSQNTLKNLVKNSWNIDSLAKQYKSILTTYQPILAMIKQEKISAQQAFLLRTLFIHEFRRILIKDHELPNSMLPKEWPGVTTMKLAEEFYHLLAHNSIAYVTDNLTNADGLLPSVSGTFHLRFSK